MTSLLSFKYCNLLLSNDILKDCSIRRVLLCIFSSILSNHSYRSRQYYKSKEFHATEVATKRLLETDFLHINFYSISLHHLKRFFFTPSNLKFVDYFTYFELCLRQCNQKIDFSWKHREA